MHLRNILPAIQGFSSVRILMEELSSSKGELIILRHVIHHARKIFAQGRKMEKYEREKIFERKL